ncbi:MAG TPA: hypothetical protein VF263_11500 [Longimicrobiaceae bacterium]
MTRKITQGLWTAGVLAGLAAGVLAAASTPTAASAQQDPACYQCFCDEYSCICSMIGCAVIDP